MNSPSHIVLSDDACLLAKFIRDGDEDAFAALVRKYENLVWNICCRILHNRCDAEDAFQSTFMLLATRAHRIRKPKSLSSWLYGVAFRTASTIRRQRQRDMQPLDSVADHQAADDVLARVAQKNENELVSAEIMLMREKYRTPLLMFYFMGNSVPDIATTLELTVSAVEGRLRQARQKLKLQLTMQGVGFDQYCSTLLIPCLAVSPSLAHATINSAMVASTSKGMTSMLSVISSRFNQFGAKMMITKLAVSCSLCLLVGVGVMHPAGMQDGDSVTTLTAADGAVVTLPIKIVNSDDDDIEDRNLHELAMSVHDELWRTWKYLTFQSGTTERLDGQDQNGKNIFVIETVEGETTIGTVVNAQTMYTNRKLTTIITNDKTTDENQAEGFTFDVILKDVEHSVEFDWVDGPPTEGDALRTITYTVQGVDDSQEVPFLSKLPVLGRLFRNVRQPQENEEFEYESDK